MTLGSVRWHSASGTSDGGMNDSKRWVADPISSGTADRDQQVLVTFRCPGYPVRKIESIFAGPARPVLSNQQLLYLRISACRV